MLIAAALYLGMFSTIAAEHTTLLRWASCCVGLFSLLWPGRVFLQSAWNALRTRTAHMDLPVALGLVTGSTAGLINTILGRGEIYFDSLSVLIFLLLVARWIQFRQQSRAADAVELLFKLTPPRARRRRDGVTTSIPVDEVSVGDTLEILPGDLVPVDAVVLDGASQLDESILSGESRPAHRAMGDTVSAGTKNLTSLLVVRTLAVGQDTRISRIVELVEQAALSKPAIVEWANRIGGVFVVVVTLLAAITLAAWLIHSPEHAVDRAVSLLIVACPCALALATPLAISVAIGRLARRKIMVKAGDVFQSLDRPGQIWLDKTGTVTEGRLSIVEWFGDELWRSRTAIAERQFIHPIADAFRSFQVDESMETSVGEALQRDGGIQATAETGRMLIGNRRLLEDDGVIIDRDWDEREQEMLAGGLSPCWISYQGRVVAMAGIGDRMRDDSGSVIEVLRSRGWRVGLLSGDHPEIVGRTGRDLGLEPSHLLAGVTPEQKLEVIELAAHDVSPVVMVGDGVNDSAALAAATVGIAVHSGAEASLAAAPVFLAREGLSPVLELIDASRSTCRIIRWNFAVSLTYNFAGAGLAMFGLINPLVAALLMPVSSLTVVAISLRAGQSATRR
jgi:Cu2+-exporting ATPase